MGLSQPLTSCSLRPVPRPQPLRNRSSETQKTSLLSEIPKQGRLLVAIGNRTCLETRGDTGLARPRVKKGALERPLGPERGGWELVPPTGVTGFCVCSEFPVRQTLRLPCDSTEPQRRWKLFFKCFVPLRYNVVWSGWKPGLLVPKAQAPCSFLGALARGVHPSKSHPRHTHTPCSRQHIVSSEVSFSPQLLLLLTPQHIW